jgi:hypothetical protein
MRRSVFLLALLGLSNSTAMGASACACFPFVSFGWDIQDHDKARARAPHVVVARMEALQKPPSSSGDCRAGAAVAAVEKGGRYEAGERLSFEVPCVERPDVPRPPSWGRAWVPWAALEDGQQARLFLGRSGKVRDFEALAASQ